MSEEPDATSVKRELSSAPMSNKKRSPFIGVIWIGSNVHQRLDVGEMAVKVSSNLKVRFLQTLNGDP
jgi:hypothetical protein